MPKQITKPRSTNNEEQEEENKKKVAQVSRLVQKWCMNMSVRVCVCMEFHSSGSLLWQDIAIYPSALSSKTDSELKMEIIGIRRYSILFARLPSSTTMNAKKMKSKE